MKSMQLHVKALPDEIFHLISGDIINGTIKQGEQIRESDYATKLSVSRSPVREALYRLEKEGIVVKKPRKGSFVKNFTIEDIYDTFKLRNNIELMASNSLSDSYFTQEIFTSFDTIISKMKNCQTHSDYTLLNFNFHYKLLSINSSNTLKEFYLKLKYPLLMFQNFNFSLENRMHLSVIEHDKMIELLKKSDLLDYQQLLTNHNQRMLRTLKDYLSN